MNKIKEIKKFVTKRKIKKFLLIYKKELEKENKRSLKSLSLDSRKKLEKQFLKYFKNYQIIFNKDCDCIWIQYNEKKEPESIRCDLYCIYQGVINIIIIDTVIDYLNGKVKTSVC